MPRSRHPNKQIEAALQHAEQRGWQVTQTKAGHNWGFMLCQYHQRDGCRHPIYSTPRNGEQHAKRLRKAVENCPHE